MYWVRTAGWLIAALYATIPSYWLVVHTRAGAWSAAGGKRLGRVAPLFFLIWAFLLAVTRRWRMVALYSAQWLWAPAGALVLSGLVIYILAARDFRTDQVLGRSELQPDRHEQRLVTRGIRAYVRHPYYLGHLCELLGWTLGTGLAVLYGLTVFAVLTGYWMVPAEERELEARFGQQYRNYKAQTPALVPRFTQRMKS